MDAVESKNAERNGQLNGHVAMMDHLEQQVLINPTLEEPAAVQRSPSAAAQAAANDQAGAQQEAPAQTSGAIKENAVKTAVSPKTAGTKPAKVKASKLITKPPKFKYVPQAQLNAEFARLEQLSRAAMGGDSKALDALRAELDHVPHVWRRLADLQLMIECQLIELIAGNDALRGEAFRKRCSELRFELLERQPSSLATQMAGSRVVATFMFVQLLELGALEAPRELKNIKQLEQAERRFQAATRTFLMAKRSDLQLRQLASRGK